MNGAADIVATAVIVALLSWCGCRLFLWFADKLIDAIDWMTRNE